MDAPVIPNELVEAAAKALAGEPRCYCPDDWRADPSPRCPAHGDGEWPTYAHYRQARAVLAAVLPLIEQRVIDRLAREAGENPYPEFHLPEHDGATGYADPCHAAWDEGAACGVAAAQEREGTARLVADHWRKAMLDAGDERMPARAAAHPLCMVLAALDGETRPEHLGITPESDEWHVLSAALSEGTPE